MIELFIENQKADINETFSSLLNFAIDDISSFGNRETTFSKTIILPGTKLNNKLFGNIFDINGSNDYSDTLPNKGINFNAAISAQAYIFNDNLQCFKGVVRLLEIVIDNGFIEYEVSVFGELGGFVAKLGNKKLEDLDFSSYDHVYSIANIVSSQDNASAGLGYYYPLMDYGNYSVVKHNWKYRTFRPALFAKEYIDKIFSQTGYTYDCDLFNTTRFKSIIVPHNRKDLTKQGSRLILAEITTPETIASISGVEDIELPFQTTSLTNFSYENGFFTYTNSSSQQLDISVVLSGQYQLDEENSNLSILLKKNDVVLDSIVYGSGLDSVVAFEAFFQVDNVLFNQFDQLSIAIRYSATVVSNFSITFNTAVLTALGDATTLVNVNLDDTVLINDTLPKNILQKDFISSIIRLFNLYVFEDRDVDKLLMIKPFIDFYADATTIDWSQKIDRGNAIRVKPMSELNSRYYEFKFKDDSDYYSDLYKKRYNFNYGSYLYDSQFEFTNETERLELIFSSTVLVGYSGEEKVYSTVFKRTGTDAAPVEEQVDSNIRLLLAKKITGVSSYNILDDDGTTVLTSLTNYAYAGHFDDPDAPANDLNFGTPNELFYSLGSGALNVNQFNVYWSSYMAEITDKDSKLLTATFKLKLMDIYNLDFSKLIYIDGSLFRLNKIQEFNATNEDTCKCELLKVINRIY